MARLESLQNVYPRPRVMALLENERSRLGVTLLVFVAMRETSVRTLAQGELETNMTGNAVNEMANGVTVAARMVLVL